MKTATRPNQLHNRDAQAAYVGRKGKQQLWADLYEAYQLYDSPNAAQAIKFLFKWYGEDTERVITAFQWMRREGVILKDSVGRD